MDKNVKIDSVLEQLFEGVCSIDITPEFRDAYEVKVILIESLRDE